MIVLTGRRKDIRPTHTSVNKVKPTQRRHYNSTLLHYNNKYCYWTQEYKIQPRTSIDERAHTHTHTQSTEHKCDMTL